MSERVLSPIRVTPHGRYFETLDGQPFLFIGFNDAVSWASLEGLYRRKDVAAADAYLERLAARGVTILRLMLEYAHFDSHLLEKPVGTFNPHMVQFWDDLLARCERLGLRVLLTPWDTFWMSRRWHKHPYNACNGGPAHTPQDFFLNEETIQASIRRLHFVIERWGASGVIAAWDLFNEIHPHWGGTVGQQSEVIGRISKAVREKEQALHGFTRPQTVSVFGPDPDTEYADLIFRHPDLDFATTHIYSKGAIDKPRNTIDSAIVMAQWTRHGLANTPADRPFMDSEHGPIHLFNDHCKMLPEAFDDEYERHMIWTHLACGGAGSGMRWPARHPHILTEGMQQSLGGMAAFARLVDWQRFAPRDVASGVRVGEKGILAFGCSDGRQAVLYMLRGKNSRNTPGVAAQREPLKQVPVVLSDMQAGEYEVHFWNTLEGCGCGCAMAHAEADGRISWTLPPLGNDMACAVRPVRREISERELQ